MPQKKVLITVKTYPTLSSKYKELVCTAGFLEDGKWVRIYPVPFRKKPYQQQYKKYDWIEIDLVKNTSDFRPESFRPRTEETEIKVLGNLNTKNNWSARKKICLSTIYTNIQSLSEEAKNKNIRTSLAVFKPTKILDFYAEKTNPNWSKQKLEALTQLNIFENQKNGKFAVVKKLPYKFKFKYLDDSGKEINQMIEDWETGRLFWKMLEKYEGDEIKAIEDVRKKYFDDFAKTKDLYFFLGTTLSNHNVSRNPFIIIGTFHPKKEFQTKLDF